MFDEIPLLDFCLLLFNNRRIFSFKQFQPKPSLKKKLEMNENSTFAIAKIELGL